MQGFVAVARKRGGARRQRRTRPRLKYNRSKRFWGFSVATLAQVLVKVFWGISYMYVYIWFHQEIPSFSPGGKQKFFRTGGGRALAWISPGGKRGESNPPWGKLGGNPHRRTFPRKSPSESQGITPVGLTPSESQDPDFPLE